ncbi:MAG: hypothetical protein ABJA66_04250, partial [Actinomycetota bacterium]
MRKLIKVIIVVVILAIGLIAFFFTRKAKMQTLKPLSTPQKAVEGLNEVKGYKNWAKVSKDNFTMNAATSIACAAAVREIPTKGSAIENSPHKDKYINVYVNSLGKDEMLTKKNPKFPIGTVVVKEKLAAPESLTPEL